jgi:bacterioferritin
MTLNTPAKPFLTDIAELRRRAQHDIDKGAVTDAYGMDVRQVVDVLNKVLASEIVCVLRYKGHYYQAKGIHAEPVAAEFLEHATSEQAHAERVAMRITQLNGDPDFNPQGMHTRAASEFGSGGGTLVDMIKEDLIAERMVIMWYSELAKWFGEGDRTTRRIMEELLADEEDHAQDLADLLAHMDRDASLHDQIRAASPASSAPTGQSHMRDAGPNGVSDGLDGR